MRVAASRRHNLRKVPVYYEIECELTDPRLDSLVRHLRTTLNRGIVRSASEEANILVGGLTPWRNLLLDHVTAEFDQDDWSRLLWDVYIASTNGAQAVTTCAKVVSNTEALGDMIVLLFSKPVSLTMQLST